ncbi:hypothetical protein ABPG75_009595 [Micractinium tetrahymenae]
MATVADFNLAKELSSSNQLSTALDLNPRWQAPEVLAEGRFSAASDIFAFGTVMWELLTWRLPWDTTTMTWQIAAHVVQGQRLEVPPPEALPGTDTQEFTGLKQYLSLMWACWEQDPSARPACAGVVQQLKALAEGLAASQAAKAAAAASAPAPPPPTAQRECRICLDSSAELLVLVPCGHRAACFECTELLLARPEGRRMCPICRAQITTSAPGSFRIFSC